MLHEKKKKLSKKNLSRLFVSVETGITFTNIISLLHSYSLHNFGNGGLIRGIKIFRAKGETIIHLNKYALLLFVVYCTPFAFLSMYDDLTNKTIIVYGLSILVICFLAFLAKRKSSLIVLLLANVLTFAHSFFWVTRVADFEEKGYYIAPFTPVSLLITVTIVFGLLQLAVYLVTKPAGYKRNLDNK